MNEYIISPYIFISDCNQLINVADGNMLENESKLYELLQFCSTEKKEVDVLDRFSPEIFNHAKKNGLIIKKDEKPWINNPYMVEIETTNYCNYKCIYCPVSQSPQKPHKVMSKIDFQRAISEVIDINASYLTLNFYNEPTLDPLFCERFEIISNTDLNCILHTNASCLNNEKLKILEYYKKNLYYIRINFPSLDPDEFSRITGNKLKPAIIDNINAIVDSGINTEIVVVGTQNEIQRNMPNIKKQFKCTVKGQRPNDRAGLLNNYYNENANISSRYCGCRNILDAVNITVDSDVLLCSFDYLRKFTVGNIKNEKLEDILHGKKAELIREIVFGVREGNYLCKTCSLMNYNMRNGRYIHLKRRFIS